MYITFVLYFCFIEVGQSRKCFHENGGCQHLCIMTNDDIAQCSCYPGFELREDKFSCRGQY